MNLYQHNLERYAQKWILRVINRGEGKKTNLRFKAIFFYMNALRF